MTIHEPAGHGAAGHDERPTGHVLMSRRIEPTTWNAAVVDGTRPRHYVFDLAERCAMRVRSPIGTPSSFGDRVRGAFFATPEAWAIARRLERERRAGEVVYATDEGLGVAHLLTGLTRTLSSRRRRHERRATCAMYVMAPRRRRVRLALALLRVLRLVPAVVVVGFPELVADAARRTGRRPSDVLLLPVTVDDRFFSPGTTIGPVERRPLIASAGLEHRNYALLAEAVRGLDVDVTVCAVSPDETGDSLTMPPEPLDNLRFEDLSIVGLRDLYRRADLFVLCTLPNGFGAGSTAVVEALSAGCPVLVCISEDDLGGLVADGLVERVDPTPDRLRAAIVELSARRADGERRPSHRLTADAYVDLLAEALGRLAARPRVPAGAS